MTDVTALAAEEPATVYFTDITDKNFPKSGPRFTPADSFPILADPRGYYTTKYQVIARDKIGRIGSPILIVQGDQHPINRFNREVPIPELQSAHKALEVSTYPGEIATKSKGALRTAPFSALPSRARRRWRWSVTKRSPSIALRDRG
jgi:hypothetical protein